MSKNLEKTLDIIVYDKKYSLLEEYNNGDVKPEALVFAKKFYDTCYHIFPHITTESKLFNLFLNTYNCYRTDNLETQLKNKDEVIDAVNMFDDILIALARRKGLNKCQVYINIERCIYEPYLFKNKKYLEWTL